MYTVNQPATQTKHPRRATFRTVVAAVIALLPALPFIVAELGVGYIPWVISLVAIAGGVTRVLAMPAVDEYLRQYAPWLAAQPKNTNENGVQQ